MHFSSENCTLSAYYLVNIVKRETLVNKHMETSIFYAVRWLPILDRKETPVYSHKHYAFLFSIFENPACTKEKIRKTTSHCRTTPSFLIRAVMDSYKELPLMQLLLSVDASQEAYCRPTCPLKNLLHFVRINSQGTSDSMGLAPREPCGDTSTTATESMHCFGIRPETQIIS